MNLFPSLLLSSLLLALCSGRKTSHDGMLKRFHINTPENFPKRLAEMKELENASTFCIKDKYKVKDENPAYFKKTHNNYWFGPWDGFFDCGYVKKTGDPDNVQRIDIDAKGFGIFHLVDGSGCHHPELDVSIDPNFLPCSLGLTECVPRKVGDGVKDYQKLVCEESREGAARRTDAP